jgi:hypothetical protein
VASGNATETQHGDGCVIVCLKLGGQIIVYFLHPSPGADEVSGESWQLATAAHGEGDGLTLCEQSS